MRVRRVILSSCLCLVTLACSKSLDVTPVIVRPVVEPASVSVAIYYADDLRLHKCTVDYGFLYPSWTFTLGPPSIEMFDVLFSTLFKDVEARQTRPGIKTPGNQRDIIELRLSQFTGCSEHWPMIATSGIDITYEAIVWSAAGKKITQWNGHGWAGPGDDLEGYAQSLFEPERAHLAALANVAMRKAAADFVVNFENNPLVRTWLVK